MSTKIEYNNAIVAEIPNGSTAKLPVKGKEMATDILVTVPEAESGGGITEVSTEAEMTALLESGEVGAIYKYVGETGIYENGALYTLDEAPRFYFSSPNSFTLNVVDNTKYWDGTLEYSFDGKTWSEWDGTTALSADDGILYMRGTGNTYITGSTASGTKARWVLTGSEISCNGNIEILRDYATVTRGASPAMTEYCYAYMFYNCSALIKMPELPAASSASYCYRSMFEGCTSLTTASALPVTILAYYCYESMFKGCTSLTTAPELPAKTLAYFCYCGMFSGCTSLTTAPVLPAKTLVWSCYYEMFKDCTSLVTAPVLPATKLKPGCYAYMFDGCTGLTAAPELPVETLATECYNAMFRGCTSLVTAPALPATLLVDRCYRSMFKGCTSLTTAPKLPATPMTDYCYESMFEDCISLTAAPELPATTLERRCYRSMFEGCTSLKLSTEQIDEYTIAYRIPTSGTGTTATDALTDMFTSTGGTFTGTPEINTTYYLHSNNEVV